mgnify:CR=1 FL=1
MTAAPFELSTLGLDRERFVRSDGKSWRGPCPRCGGHRRFVLWTDKPFPKWNHQCDQCGLKGFADELNTSLRQPVSAEQRAEWSRRNAVEAAARAELRRRKLAEYTVAELWDELHERLTAAHRQTWRNWGVPDDWQDYLRLGYTPDKIYVGGDGEQRHSPAFTIPYFHTGFEFKTMQYRLADPDNPADRYRFEHGLGTTYYQAMPGEPVGERALIVEGAKKAMVTHIHAQLDGVTVLAVPSKADFGGVAEAVKDCGRVHILLDPDAEARAHKLAREIGPRAAVAVLPDKLDDFILDDRTAAPKLVATALRWGRT